jgi:hypothetical protein
MTNNVRIRQYVCPECHLMRESFSTPYHRHGERWVALKDDASPVEEHAVSVPLTQELIDAVTAAAAPVKRGPGRPRKTPQ